ncbi:hypothetical protein F2Q69_00028349 [Brassica cretica]|uniref:Uncharacterized protein n=1 Tax=Brassica cretica TaxID=69181 RepID=A0A8S9S844_BRACR|nr:hypothetical protein F2Q69_00028349 [Brassica cretica]
MFFRLDFPLPNRLALGSNRNSSSSFNWRRPDSKLGDFLVDGSVSRSRADLLSLEPECGPSLLGSGTSIRDYRLRAGVISSREAGIGAMSTSIEALNRFLRSREGVESKQRSFSGWPSV